MHGLNEMEQFAFKELRKVIWDKEPQQVTYPVVAEEYGLTDEEAIRVTEKAWEKWVEVYYPD